MGAGLVTFSKNADVMNNNIQSREIRIDAVRSGLIILVETYARRRLDDVRRGAENPSFAGLLVQKYGLGLADAAALIYDCPTLTQAIQSAVDAEVEKLDPAWRDGQCDPLT
jgi:hypothetical protein